MVSRRLTRPKPKEPSIAKVTKSLNGIRCTKIQTLATKKWHMNALLTIKVAK